MLCSISIIKIISTLKMSFLQTKSINPHLHIFALSLAPLSQQPETPLQRLNLLARTRRFDDIQAAAAEAKEFNFPTLINKLSQAKQNSKQQRQKLGEEKIFETIKQLDILTQGEDPDFEKLDQEQFKVFKLAQILFQEGNYAKSYEILTQLEKQDVKEQLWLKSTWARLYCEIILNRNSVKTIQSLKKKIEEIENDETARYNKEKKDASKIIKKYYAQKQEFLLLSCFTYFGVGKITDETLEKFVETCTSDKSYFSVLQLAFPQLLRYLIVAIALNKTLQINRAFDLFKLVEVINRKIINYSDSFSEFISLLHIEYDFDGVTSKIQECRQLIRTDIFLAPLEERIIQGLQFLYFKLACKVYQTIPLKDISNFTGKSEDEAELWILSFIRSGDIQAKIDSISGLILNNKGKHSTAQKYAEVVPSLSTFVNSLSRAIANQ